MSSLRIYPSHPETAYSNSAATAPVIPTRTSLFSKGESIRPHAAATLGLGEELGTVPVALPVLLVIIALCDTLCGPLLGVLDALVVIVIPPLPGATGTELVGVSETEAVESAMLLGV